MAHKSDLIASDIEGYLKAHEQKGLLRFITCGSVDDGKSTLIGRLLYESKMIFDDHLKALESESRKFGTQGERIDFALLVDGLAAEREQGITIDVAYRFFSTERRKFIVADTPGHEQYTRNMATGASTADLAILLVDARKGILTQTRRHSYIVSLLGVKQIVLAVNKMDLVGYSREIFERIRDDYLAFARQIGLDDIVAIPISALEGDNIVERGSHLDWFTGPALMTHLETVEIEADDQAKPFRMPVQRVSRPNLDFRGFCGRIASGVIRPGDRVKSMPSGVESAVKEIFVGDSARAEAVAGESVTLTLADEIDASRGDILCAAASTAQVSDQLETRILWMSPERLLPGRPYLMKSGTRTVSATLAPPKYKVNVNTLEHLAAPTLELNEIGLCVAALDRPVAFDPYEKNHATGGFILIDRISNATVAMGLVQKGLRVADETRWSDISVDRAARAALKGQKPAVLWFTGVYSSGKTTIANLVEKMLHAQGRHTAMINGDLLRQTISRDLEFDALGRIENLRRAAETARLMNDAGLIVLASFISPYKAERRRARERIGEGAFVEIFVDAPAEEARRRDSKGLYRKAERGELTNFTAIDVDYETPEAPEIHIDTTKTTPEEAAARIVAWMDERGLLSPEQPDYDI